MPEPINFPAVGRHTPRRVHVLEVASDFEAAEAAQPQTSGPSLRRIHVVQRTCYLCGQEQERLLTIPQALLDTRARCTRCGGCLHGEVLTAVYRDDSWDWHAEETPRRRGRPPRWLLEQRAAAAADEQQE